MEDWKERLKKASEANYVDFDQLLSADEDIKGRRAALANGTGSVVMVDESGNIGAKTDALTGLSIDKATGAVTLSGNKLALMFEEIDLYTMPFQFRINKFTFNWTPVMAPGQGPILPDGPAQIAKGLQGIAKQVTKILS